MDTGFSVAWFVKATWDWVLKRGPSRADRQAAEVRVADHAVALGRQLSASFEDWRAGPQTLEERAKWAVKLVRGFPATDASLAAMLEARARASSKVCRAAEKARKEYYAIADVVNPLVPAVINPEIKRFWEVPEVAAADGQLRRAWAHMRPCLAALSSARAVND